MIYTRSTPIVIAKMMLGYSYVSEKYEMETKHFEQIIFMQTMAETSAEDV